MPGVEALIAADAGARVLARRLDVRDEARAAEVAGDVAATFGRCDILVNNAAGWLTGTLGDADRDSIHEAIDVTVKGPIFMARAFWGLLSAADPAYIVNITTLGARPGRSNASPVYVAAKFGL